MIGNNEEDGDESDIYFIQIKHELKIYKQGEKRKKRFTSSIPGIQTGWIPANP